ncbi:MAG TPA: phytanoyl-CoA dioxygenase, partial [Rhizobiales bacterium]|nr:phytanoyl-CoA dioxygenase [Hyphomicrobiales bacterium]
LAQVFTQSKSFAANPVIGSRLLNRAGLHVARVIAAHAMRRVRLLFIAPFIEPEKRAEFWRNGFIVVENFLDPQEFAVLTRQIEEKAKDLPARECVQGDTLTQRVLLDEKACEKLPAVKALTENRQYRRLSAYVAASWKRPLYYIQRIRNGYNPGAPDPQKVLHADTFHPTMKAWFFLDEVTPDMGPFTYSPGSHRLTWNRIKWEYRQSLKGRDLDNSYARRGSLRADDHDLNEMGYAPRKSLAVKANTLVVADTHGFHCRGQATGKVSRLELWAYCRTNPFNPFPGLGLSLVSRIENAVAKKYWQHEDKKAAARGEQSSWHVIPGTEMLSGG